MSRAFDAAVAIRFLKQLVTPFTQTDAYRLGIIDRNGNKIREPRSISDRRAYTKMNVIVFNLKKLIAKIPGGQNKLSSYAAAGWLLKEHEETPEAITEQAFFEALELFDEEAAANAAGAGAVAGIGVGPDGEPGVDKKTRKKYKKKNQLDNTNLLTRAIPK